MIRFNCDYQEAAHPRILERIMKTNMDQMPGYGEDAVCDAARARIRELCAAPDADVQFLVGGTQANFTLLAAALRTHQGALIGEAMVISSAALKRDFRYVLKQKGGMLAKGWLLGIQFDELLRDGLYFELSKHAVGLAMKLKAALKGMDVPFLVDSPTNQQFPILPDAKLAELGKEFSYSYQCRIDETHSAVRLCTSWATREEDVDALIAALKRALGK